MSKKATFVLDEHMVLEVKEVVGEGLFKSMNAFVEAAIRDELAKIKKERIRKAFMEASKDRLFFRTSKPLKGILSLRTLMREQSEL